MDHSHRCAEARLPPSTRAGRSSVEPQETDEGTHRQAPQGFIVPAGTALQMEY